MEYKKEFKVSEICPWLIKSTKDSQIKSEKTQENEQIMSEDEETQRIILEKIKQMSESPIQYKKEFKVSEICTYIKPTKDSHRLILEMVSERRPYRPSDFKPQSFIPDLDGVDFKKYKKNTQSIIADLSEIEKIQR